MDRAEGRDRQRETSSAFEEYVRCLLSEDDVALSAKAMTEAVDKIQQSIDEEIRQRLDDIGIVGVCDCGKLVVAGDHDGKSYWHREAERADYEYE